MTEMQRTPEESSPAMVSPVRYEQDDRGSSRVHQGLAWVGIVAGTLFIIAMIFFSGFFLGRALDGPNWRHGYTNSQMGPGGMSGHGGMMGPGGGMMGPGGGMMGPGGGMMGPGSMPEPTQTRSTPSPTRQP